MSEVDEILEDLVMAPEVEYCIRQELSHLLAELALHRSTVSELRELRDHIAAERDALGVRLDATNARLEKAVELLEAPKWWGDFLDWRADRDAFLKEIEDAP